MSEMQPAYMVIQIRNFGHTILQDENAPPRSHLYSLPPCNVETIWRESLTGYINRLAKTHHISPRDLVAQEILPRLGDDFSLSSLRLAHFDTISNVVYWCRAEKPEASPDLALTSSRLCHYTKLGMVSTLWGSRNESQRIA